MQIQPESYSFVRKRLSDSRRYSGEDFLQRTLGKLGRNSKIQNMGFLQKIPIYQTLVKFAEKSERFGIFSGCSEHIFHKYDQLINSTQFLLMICLFKQQISTEEGRL